MFTFSLLRSSRDSALGCLALFLPSFLLGAPVLASQPPAELGKSGSLTRPTPIVDEHFPWGQPPGDPPISDPQGGGATVLQVDDGSAESVFGFSGPGTRQFLFFNRFESPGLFVLESIQVLFPAGTEIEPGGAIELVVYVDSFGDPTLGGAVLRLQVDEVVQATDGVTFSTYDLVEPLELFTPGDILIGVINRYYDASTTPAITQPAAVDTTSPSDDSFFALWSGDAAQPPELSTAIEIAPFSGLIAGNYMIRASGRLTSVIEIPTLDHWGLAVLVILLLAVALAVLPRQS